MRGAGGRGAEIKVSNEKKYLGCFKTFDEAVAIRKAAERFYGFHENHGMRLNDS
jgi:hypothetical protein